MTSRILWKVADALRSSPLPLADNLTLTAQLLVWARIGNTAWVDHSVPSLGKAIETGGELLRVGLSNLEGAGGTLGEAFSGAQRRAEMAGQSLQSAAVICHQLERDGILDGLQLDELFFSLGSDARSELTLYHSSLVDLMVRLAGPTLGTTTYCPWDQMGQAASAVLRAGGAIAVENALITPFPALAATFVSKPCRTAYGDPIRSPSFIEGGKLERFEQAVALPPLGVKVGSELIEGDLFERFDIPKATWTVLCIQHLMAQAHRRAVIVVPHSLLFGVGADKKLREKLVRAGQVRSVISLFPGLASGTAIQLAILVLDPRGGTQQVRFVNAISPPFKSQLSRAKVSLDNLEELVRVVESGADSEVARSIEISEIIQNEYSLQPERYVLDPSTVSLQKRLAPLKTVALGDLVSIVRTASPARAESEGIPVLEVGTADIPRTGYSRPGRQVIAGAVASPRADHFLRKDDIVVTVRGNVGKVGIIASDAAEPGPGGWTAGSSLAVLRVRPEVSVDPAALMLLLRSPLGKELLSRVSSGVTIPMITLRDLLRLQVPVPTASAGGLARGILAEEELLHEQIAELISRQESVAGSDPAFGLLD